MKRYTLTLDEDLIDKVDDLASREGTSRSEFVRKALSEALRKRRNEELERELLEGYRDKPPEDDEFGSLFEEPSWPN